MSARWPLRGLSCVLVVGALAVTGCGGTTAGPAATTSAGAGAAGRAAATFSKDPCALLTNDEVARVLGASPATTVPVPHIAGGYRQCQWVVPGNGSTATLFYIPDQQEIDNLKSQVAGRTPLFGGRLLDIGDGAAETPVGVQVLVGDSGFQVLTLPSSVDREADLARLAVARLP
jgi:uncharacterized protein DUF3558